MGLQENLHSETVRELALREPVTVHPDTPVREVVEKMKARRLGCAIVVDAGHKPLGMFTESMLIERLSAGERELNTSVSDWMATQWPCVNEHDPIVDVLDAMRTRNVRFLCVVDDDGKLVGLTGQRGLLEYVADHFPSQVMVQRIGGTPHLRSREGA